MVIDIIIKLKGDKMMLKTLSQQICEECGMKPANKRSPYFSENYGKYPNFNKPENFEKLLNLKFGKDNEDLISMFWRNAVDVSNSTKLLEKILRILKYNDLEISKEIAEAIRQTDWVY